MVGDANSRQAIRGNIAGLRIRMGWIVTRLFSSGTTLRSCGWRTSSQADSTSAMADWLVRKRGGEWRIYDRDCWHDGYDSYREAVLWAHRYAVSDAVFNGCLEGASDV